MSTGLSSLSKLSEVTTLYPFAGMEYVFTLGLLAFFVLFFFWQIGMEHLHIKKIIGMSKSESAPSGAAMAPAE